MDTNDKTVPVPVIVFATRDECDYSNGYKPLGMAGAIWSDATPFYYGGSGHPIDKQNYDLFKYCEENGIKWKWTTKSLFALEQEKMKNENKK